MENTISENPSIRFDTKVLGVNYDYLAPDQSEIRLLSRLPGGSMCHCILPIGKVSIAVFHKTVEEIWYVMKGEGEIWRKKGEFENVTSLSSGTCLTIPLGTDFQFRTIGEIPLEILITTMPPWPGQDEAVLVEGKWK
jgi:mannose-6-phosphate isomerase-like protein (cupin superfamily)